MTIYVKTFDDFTSTLRHMLTHAMKEEQAAMAKIAEATNKGNALGWYSQDLMKASNMRLILQEVARWHESAIRGYLNADDLKDESAAKDWEAAALKLYKNVAATCLDRIYRGTESSSNPMTILETVAQIDAYKKVLDGLCNYGRAFVDHDFLSDAIDAGIARRKADEEAKAKLVERVTYRAASTTTLVIEARNHRGHVLERLAELKSRAKKDGKEAAEEYAKLFSEKQGTHVHVSEAK